MVSPCFQVLAKPCCDTLRFTPAGQYVDGSPYQGGGLDGAGYGITLDPNFASNGFVYIYYTHATRSGSFDRAAGARRSPAHTTA